MMVPEPRSSMCGITAPLVTKTERALRLSMRSQSSIGVSWIGWPVR